MYSAVPLGLVDSWERFHYRPLRGRGGLNGGRSTHRLALLPAGCRSRQLGRSSWVHGSRMTGMGLLNDLHLEMQEE